MADENRRQVQNEAASVVAGAVKTGKAASKIAKGAAAGGWYGAAISAAWSLKKYIPAIIAVLLLPVIIIAMLPSIIFGSFFGDSTDTKSGIVDDAILTQNMVDISTGISTILSEGMNDTIDAVNADFSASSCDAMEVNNPYASNIVFSTNHFISQYCASLDKDVESISKSDLESILRENKSHLYSFTYKDEAREVETTVLNEETSEYETESTTINVRVYSIIYNGEAYFGDVIFHLDDGQKTLARNYAQNLSVLLRDDIYRSLGGSDPSFSYENSPFSGSEIDLAILRHPSTKNAEDLVAYVINAYENGWGYVWGTFGGVMTESLLASKMNQYPDEVGGKEDIIREKWMGHRVTDCVGLLKSYSWFNPDTLSIEYATNGMPDYGANQMYYSATKSGTIDTMPEIPGLAVWHDGHIGVYIGGGYVIEAMGTSYGVVKTSLADRNWTHWLEIAFILY